MTDLYFFKHLPKIKLQSASMLLYITEKMKLVHILKFPLNWGQTASIIEFKETSSIKWAFDENWGIVCADKQICKWENWYDYIPRETISFTIICLLILFIPLYSEFKVQYKGEPMKNVTTTLILSLSRFAYKNIQRTFGILCVKTRVCTMI